jgi:hypothetical protein
MKAPLFRLLLAASAAPFLSAAEIEPGTPLEEVRAALGPPKGQALTAERQVLYYERGEIELRDGKVVRANLRTAEEHAAMVAREERLRADQEARREQLMAEGVALRDRKLADPAFLAAPVAFQVAFWENFARTYPGVSCTEPLTIARLRLNEQLEERMRKNEEISRLAELEARFAAAEREPVHYRVAYPGYYGRRDRDRYQEFGLGPVKYTYFDAPLPVYTTPTMPLINAFQGDPAQPERRDYERGGGHSRRDRDYWRHDDRDDRDRRGGRGWRDSDRGRGHRGNRY